MKTIIAQTYLPVFPGLDGTYFEPNESLELDSVNAQRQENDLDPLDFEDLDFDYEGYKNDVGEACTSYVEDLLSNLKIVKEIKFIKFISPKNYDSENDSIDVEIEYFPENLSKYIIEHFDSFQNYINTYSRKYEDKYDNSFSNNPNDWKNETNNFTVFTDNYKLGTCLDFICRDYYNNNNLNKTNGSIELDMYHYITDYSGVYFGVKDFEFETNKVKSITYEEFYLPNMKTNDDDDDYDNDDYDNDYYDDEE